MPEKISYEEIIKKIKPELEKVVSFLERELKKIRTERASPSLVEDIKTECFGQTFPLKQLAGISVSGAREILIQPWDQSYIEYIVKALERNGMNVIVEKNLIRIQLPPLSEEFRKDLIQLISEKREQVRKTIRRWREEAWGEIQECFREGKISEDDKYKGKEKLQDLIDEYNEKVDQMIEKKKKEIME